VPGQLGVIRVVGGEHAVEGSEHRGIAGGVDQPLLVDALEKRLRAVPDRVPQSRVQPREEAARRPVPGVPKVVGEILEPQQALRNLGMDLEEEMSPRSVGHGA
jgi:hypothetical protein